MTVTKHPEVDTFVSPENPNSNYGASETLVVQNTSNYKDSYSMFRFDLTEIDMNENIYLHLYISNYKLNGTFYIILQELIKNWDEGEPTFNNFSDYKAGNEAIAYEANAADITTGWLTITITPTQLPKLVKDNKLSFFVYLSPSSKPTAGFMFFKSKESLSNKPYVEGRQKGGICVQSFMVLDQAGAPLGGAKVTVGEKTCTTDIGYGSCAIQGLVETGTYLAVATKEGYECYTPSPGATCKKEFNCPHSGGTIVLWLKEKAEYCEQTVRVVGEDGNPIPQVSVAACKDNFSYDSCLTNEDGTCLLSVLKAGVTYDYIEAAKTGYATKRVENVVCDPNTTIVITFEERLCESTGIYCDARISGETVPEVASEDSDVSGNVIIDNLCSLPLDNTRYRVKFTRDQEPAMYSDSFIIGGWNFKIVPFEFIMPNHDVTLIAEIERCNINGEWENAGPEYKKTYTIRVGIAGEFTFNVTIKDENGLPVPNALIDTDVWTQITPIDGWYHEKRCTDNNVTIIHGECGGPETAFADDEGYNIITDSNGQATFRLPGLAWPDIKWGLRVAKEGYYNEKGEKGWTNYLDYDTPSKTYSVEFTLFTTPVQQEVSFIMPLLYGSIAVGTYVSGSIVSSTPSPKTKAIGSALKIGTLIPAGLCGYELYNLINNYIHRFY